MLTDVADEDQDFDDVENEEDGFVFEMYCESDLEESEDEDNDAIYIHHFWDGCNFPRYGAFNLKGLNPGTIMRDSRERGQVSGAWSGKSHYGDASTPAPWLWFKNRPDPKS